MEITVGGYAYGHHGDCQGWNGCGDAATCALWACLNEGYDVLVSHGSSAACGSAKPFSDCHLLYNGPSGGVQYEWWAGWHAEGGSCDVLAVGEIVCAYSEIEPAPAPEPGPEIDGGTPVAARAVGAGCRGETCPR